MKYRHPILLVLLPFASGYFLSYFYRTINAVISADLSSGMHLRASDLGLLTAVYFLSFAAMQLPVGVALDRYGPRRVQGILLLVAALGAALFGVAETLAGFIIGRALIGFGVAAALIAGLKSIRLWFPKEQLPLLNGCFIMLGTLGALHGDCAGGADRSLDRMACAVRGLGGSNGRVRRCHHCAVA